MHTIDRNEFNQRLAKILTDLEEQNEEEFLRYLRQNYCNRLEEWAPWARRQAVVNCNMAIERWNRTLKQKYLKNSQNQRIDQVVYQLQKATVR